MSHMCMEVYVLFYVYICICLFNSFVSLSKEQASYMNLCYVCVNLYIYRWIWLCVSMIIFEMNIFVCTCMLICVLTLTEGLLTRSSMIPNSAAWEETFSLLIEPTQGLWIPNCGATLIYAWLGICQNISSGTLSGNTKLDKKMQETDLVNPKKKNIHHILLVYFKKENQNVSIVNYNYLPQ